MDTKCSCEQCELKSLFFENVSEVKIEEICTQKKEIEYNVGDIIVESGEPILDFLYLKSGLVKLFRIDSQGNEQIFTFAKPFDFVSLLNVFVDTTYNYSVIALEPSVTCNINYSELKSLVVNNGAFALSIIKKLSRVSDKIIQESLEIKQRNLKGRVAYMLLFFADVIYQDNYFSLPVSRKEIANYIGMSTENVIRALSEFRKEEILGIFGKHIDIMDKERLMKISELG